jgi:hypothetical protein
MRRVHLTKGDDERQTQKLDLIVKKSSARAKKANSGKLTQEVLHGQASHDSRQDVDEQEMAVPSERILDIDVEPEDNGWKRLQRGVRSGQGSASEEMEAYTLSGARVRGPRTETSDLQIENPERLFENGTDAGDQVRSGKSSREQHCQTESNASLTLNNDEPNPSTRRLRPSAGANWENLKETIQDLYVVQDLSLGDVKRTMERSYNFRAR